MTVTIMDKMNFTTNEKEWMSGKWKVFALRLNKSVYSNCLWPSKSICFLSISIADEPGKYKKSDGNSSGGVSTLK